MVIMLILRDKVFYFRCVDQRLLKFLASIKQTEAVFLLFVFNEVVKDFDGEIIVEEISLAIEWILKTLQGLHTGARSDPQLVGLTLVYQTLRVGIIVVRDFQIFNMFFKVVDIGRF